MPIEITPQHMAKAKERFAEILWLRLRIADTGAPDSQEADPALEHAMLNVILSTLDADDIAPMIALVLAGVQFGWMTADFAAQGVGRELDDAELTQLIELFQSDDQV